jgi:uncharacterized protein YoxC
MEINWNIFGPIAVALIVFIVFLIRKNLKDEKKVEQYFIDEAEGVETEDSEPNDPS